MSSRECNAFEAVVVPESGGEFCHVLSTRYTQQTSEAVRVAPIYCQITVNYRIRPSSEAGGSGVPLGVKVKQQVVQLGKQRGPGADRHRWTGRPTSQSADDDTCLASD